MFPLISRPFKYIPEQTVLLIFHVYRCKSYSYWSLCRDTSCTETSSLQVIKFKFSENTKQVLNHQEHILFPDRRYFFFTFWDIFNFIYRYNISSILLLGAHTVYDASGNTSFNGDGHPFFKTPPACHVPWCRNKKFITASR